MVSVFRGNHSCLRYCPFVPAGRHIVWPIGHDLAGDGVELLPVGQIVLQDHELPFQFQGQLHGRCQDDDERSVRLTILQLILERLDDLGAVQKPLEVFKDEQRQHSTRL